MDNGDGKEEEALDPRIKSELERLNAATDGINHLETEHGEAQALFQQMMQDATTKLKATGQKMGKSVEKARVYYDALKAARQSHTKLHEAALKFEQAQSRHFNAKKRVGEAERIAFSSTEGKLDPALQEMLNQATVEVMEAAKQADDARSVHRNASVEFETRNKEVQKLSKTLKKNIMKSRPYFELKNTLNKQLDIQKKRVEKVQEGIQHSKLEYAKTLQNLEVISNDIHRSRKAQTMEVRGEGVGAESDTEDAESSVDYLNDDRLSFSRSCDSLSESDDDESPLKQDMKNPANSRTDTKHVSGNNTENHKKSTPSINDLSLEVHRTLSDSCADLSYDVITSHSIPFSPPVADFVDNSSPDKNHLSVTGQLSPAGKSNSDPDLRQRFFSFSPAPQNKRKKLKLTKSLSTDD